MNFPHKNGFEGVNKFYKNEGDMNFTDISSTIGFFQTDLFTYGVSFADMDNDGDFLHLFQIEMEKLTIKEIIYIEMMRVLT